MKNLNKEQQRALKWLLSKGMSITRSKKNYKIFDDLLNELEPSSITAVVCQREQLCGHLDIGTDGGGDYCKKCGKRWG